MTTLVKKMKGNKAYYYAVQSARVNGKPRIVWQKYLGSLDTIIKRAQQDTAPLPTETALFEAGGVAALLAIAARLGLLDLINQVIPKRDQGPSVGHYVLLAALNRVLDPSSKSQIGEWYHGTILQRLWGFSADAFTSQRYWDHMSMISEEAIDKLQDLIAEKVRKEFKIETDTLLYDSTNFFTYIDTNNEKSKLSERGHNKQKRGDLRQVNLALLTTREFQIPLFHKAYRGDIPDIKFFPEVAKTLLARHKSLSGNINDSTLVFDKGNLSEESMQQLLISGIHFVSGVKADVAPDIFEAPIELFLDSATMPGTKLYQTPIELCGRKCTAVVSYSESFFAEQLASITSTMTKCQDKLKSLQTTVIDWGLQKKKAGKRPTLTMLRSKVKEILSSQHMKDIFSCIIDQCDGQVIFKYSINKKSLEKLTSTRLGRTLLISNRAEWVAFEVVSTYRGLSNIEDAFKLMKNRDYLHWQPSFHWTDQKVQVHTFYCVIALLLATLARKIAHEGGVEISMVSLLDSLSGIKEVALLYCEKDSKVKAHFTLNSMTPRQKKLLDLFNLDGILDRG